MVRVVSHFWAAFFGSKNGPFPPGTRHSLAFPVFVSQWYFLHKDSLYQCEISLGDSSSEQRISWLYHLHDDTGFSDKPVEFSNFEQHLGIWDPRGHTVSFRDIIINNLESIWLCQEKFDPPWDFFWTNLMYIYIDHTHIYIWLYMYISYTL